MIELKDAKIHEWPEFKKPLPKNEDIGQRLDQMERNIKQLSDIVDNLLIELLEHIKKGK